MNHKKFAFILKATNDANQCAQASSEAKASLVNWVGCAKRGIGTGPQYRPYVHIKSKAIFHDDSSLHCPIVQQPYPLVESSGHGAMQG